MTRQKPGDDRIPVTIVTGFLGAGKTTLLNRMLTERHGRKIAVIENEFGEVGIDDALLTADADTVVELTDGCVCCTVRDDLNEVLASLLERRDRFDHIVIETTGLADPAPVAETFFGDDEVVEQLRLDAVVTVVDAAHVVDHLDDEKPDGVENEAVEQIAFADRIVLNKTDLVDAATLAEVTARIEAINAAAEIITAERADVDLARVLDVGAFDLDRVREADPSFLTGAGHRHDAQVTSVGIDVEGELDQELLSAWMGELLWDKGADIFRSKGVLAVEGFEQQYIFQGVHTLFVAELGRPWPAGEPRRSRMVFIGRNLDRDELVRGFEACLTA